MVFSKHSKHFPEISFHAIESNHADKRANTHINWTSVKQNTHPHVQLLLLLPPHHRHPPPPIYPPSPPNCTPCSLVPLKQITPRWLSAHFSNYVRITTSNPIISQTLIFQGLSADHLLGEPGFSRQNLSTIMFKWFCPDGLDSWLSFWRWQTATQETKP